MDYETRLYKALDDLQKHPVKWEKALYHYIWYYRDFEQQVDIYYNPESGSFTDFINVGGNSWIDDDHITIYTIDNSNSDDWTPGNIRETAKYYRESGVRSILNGIESDLIRAIDNI